jgi:hypothetical protein
LLELSIVAPELEGMDHLESTRIGIMLGLGDAHGPATINWTLRQFQTSGQKLMQAEAIPFGTPPRDHPAIPWVSRISMSCAAPLVCAMHGPT